MPDTPAGPPLTITEAARALAAGDWTAESLVARGLARIAAQDRPGAGLHAILSLNPEAQEQARALDREWAQSGLRGKLHGIPLVIKDNIDVAGLPTTSGCRALAQAMPKQESRQVERLRRAGAVILAKTNLSEFCFQIRSRSSLGGDVRNPYRPQVTAGGSSGGTAAAIAAGFAWGGLGTDTGGSIRVPASCCGLVGLRPTHGLLDMHGIAPCAPSADTVGPMARSVADVALLLEAARPGAAQPSGEAVPSWRVGVLRQAFGADPEIIGAMETALARLAQRGVQVIDPVALPEAVLPSATADIVDFIHRAFPPAFDAYLASNFSSGAPASLDAIRRSGDTLAEYEATLQRMCSAPVGRDRFDRIMAARHALGAALRDLMQTHRLDALVYPTSAALPDSLDNPAGGWAPELAACSGQPALTLPVAQAASLVPIGLELLGRSHGEGDLLRLGAFIEQVAGCRLVPGLLTDGA